jgi:AAHS family 4-hydroxybenzoate transporter-like MFS transporter
MEPGPSPLAAADAREAVNLTDIIDAHPLGALQIRLLVLCGFVALLDGLDLQAIGLAAPGIIAALHVEPRVFGAVFSAALLGLTLGAAVLGPMADRIGRKRILIASTITFGVFTVCTALATSFPMLLACRFLTGLGLGGAMPSFISLASEYVPRQRHALWITLLWAGFPLGGVIGGVLASFLIPRFGWPSVFYLGGVTPIVLAMALSVALPESIGFLVNSGAPAGQIVTLLRRMFPGEQIPDYRAFRLAERPLGGMPVRHLFEGRRGLGTLFLWIAYFTAFLMLVTNSSWSPTVLQGAGITLPETGLIMAAYNGGSVLGTVLVGWLISLFGVYPVLSVLLLLSAFAFGAVGFGVPSFRTTLMLEGAGGAFLGAGSSGLIALAAAFYPTSIRSTGVGWATAVGRFGSFTGPLLAASLIGMHWDVQSLYIALGAPGILSAIGVVLLGISQHGDAAVHE